MNDRQRIEHETAIHYGNAYGERFVNGQQPICFDVDIYAWQAALSYVIPADCVVSVKQSTTDHLAYTVTLRCDDATRQRFGVKS